MAVLIETYSVVVRRATLDAKYPGGSAAYERDRPNETYCADEHLTRVGFMVLDDAKRFVAALAGRGLTPSRDDAAADVAITSDRTGPLLPCDWLETAAWEGTPLAWLAGTTPTALHAPAGWSREARTRHWSADEIREKLEYVRTDDHVDVYRDKATGQELYVGRTSSSAEDTERHNQLYEEASRRIDGLILLDDRPPRPLDAAATDRLRGAVSLFEEVVRINPGNYAAMWLVGKVYQRLEEYDASLEWFARAHRVNPGQRDVAREASIAAMNLRRPELAVEFCQAALKADPNNAGLQANLALALLFCGRPVDAEPIARTALADDPADPITARILGIIEDVLAGSRPCPAHVSEI